MHLNDKQRKEINDLIEKAKIIECAKANNIIESVLAEWKNGEKTDLEAYHKIFKKVTKNNQHLTHRYNDIDDAKSLITLSEVFSDDIINTSDFEQLDEFVKKEVFRITGIGY